MKPCPALLGLGVMGLLLLTAPSARAARARFHYVPAGPCGALTLQPDGPCDAVGERITWFGTVRQGDSRPPRTNQMVTFKHPYTGQSVVVPLALPEGTPNMEYRTNRILYNYGSYSVAVHFLADGSVDVVYDSGFFRKL